LHTNCLQTHTLDCVRGVFAVDGAVRTWFSGAASQRLRAASQAQRLSNLFLASEDQVDVPACRPIFLRIADTSLSLPFSSPPYPSHNANPHHTNHNIEPLALPSLILITPHPILLIIPKRPRRRMHAPPANHAVLPPFTRGMLAVYGIRSQRCRVLDDGAGDGELVGGGAMGGGGFGDEGLEDGVLGGLSICTGGWGYWWRGVQGEIRMREGGLRLCWCSRRWCASGRSCRRIGRWWCRPDVDVSIAWGLEVLRLQRFARRWLFR